MIELFYGDNSFEIERAVNEAVAKSQLQPEKLEGDQILPANLPDILCGATLFSDKRLIVIKNLSDNKASWSALSDILPRISDDIHVILIEKTIDKRTLVYKNISKVAKVQEFKSWDVRDSGAQVKWLIAESKKQNISLDQKTAIFLLERVGIDQWALFHAIEKLSLVDTISIETIKNIIEANPVENVFNLFETALRGDRVELKNILRTLEQSEDIYRLSALLFTQAFQLAAVVSAAKTDNVGKDFGIHPYVVSKLEPIAKQIGKSGVSKIIAVFAEADEAMKLSRAEPWLLIERALMKIATN